MKKIITLILAAVMIMIMAFTSVSMADVLIESNQCSIELALNLID